MLWLAFDVATFGAFEKPQNHSKGGAIHPNDTHVSLVNNTMERVKYIKVVEYKYVNDTVEGQTLTHNIYHN